MKAICPEVPAFRPYEEKHDPHHLVEVVDGCYAYHYVVPGIFFVCPYSGMKVEDEILSAL